MSIKIYFYAQLDDKINEEKFLNRYQTLQKEDSLYQIEAKEICSEFISRYFNKLENGIYKAKISQMLEDRYGNFEFKAFKDCKRVRENLLTKYQEFEQKFEENMNTRNISIYALLDV